ncbi:nucleotidyltransferase domain-containing protein [candidate division WOR-3 bacterium]|nr:nucleotidyltransferase domain-containing protein [candidate division WOR-3 bacterium]
MIKLKRIKGNIRKRLKTLKGEVKDFKGLSFLYLFGSYAREEENNLSDIDIAFYLKERDNEENIEAQLYDKISSHLRTDEITFICLNEAPLFISSRVIEEGVILYEKDKIERMNFLENTVKKYLDFFPYYRENLNVHKG